MSTDLVTTAMFLGAGLGERLRPITNVTPKILVDIAGAPLLWHWAEEFRRAGITDVVVNTHHLRPIVRLALDELNRLNGPRFHEAYEQDLLGTAGTISANLSWAGASETCLIVYGDNYPPPNLRNFVAYHAEGSYAATLSLSEAPDPTICGIVTVDADMKITSFTEKPPNPLGNLAFNGLIALSSPLWREIAAINARDIGSEVLPKLLGRLRGWQSSEAWFDIGTHAGLNAARRYADTIASSRSVTSTFSV